MDGFNSQKFSIRKQAVKYIIENYGIDKHLVQRDLKTKSGYVICLQCENINCSFQIYCEKYRRANSDGCFKYENVNSCFN